MPKWDLDLNTSWNNTNNTRYLQGGLYDIDINPIDIILPNNFENNQNQLIELLKNIKSKEEKNTIDTEFLDDSFSNWYNNNFRNSILPKKDIMEKVILQKVNNKHYLIDRNSIKTTSKDLIEMIESNDNNSNKEDVNSLTINGNIILCFFYSDKQKNKKLTPHEMKIYNEQGILLDLNNNNQPKQDEDKNWIINNNLNLNNQLIKLHNETLSKLKKITDNQPTLVQQDLVQQTGPETILNQPNPQPEPISKEKENYYNNLLNKINNIEKETELDKLADSLNKGRLSPQQVGVYENQLDNILKQKENNLAPESPSKQISKEKFNQLVDSLENNNSNNETIVSKEVLPTNINSMVDQPVVREEVLPTNINSMVDQPVVREEVLPTNINSMVDQPIVREEILPTNINSMVELPVREEVLPTNINSMVDQPVREEVLPTNINSMVDQPVVREEVLPTNINSMVDQPVVVEKDISDGEILQKLINNIETSEEEPAKDIIIEGDNSLKIDLNNLKNIINEKEAFNKYLKYKRKYLSLKKIINELLINNVKWCFA